jgi:hypothetical protein
MMWLWLLTQDTRETIDYVRVQHAGKINNDQCDFNRRLDKAELISFSCLKLAGA